MAKMSSAACIALFALVFTSASCNRNQGPDPADANLAPAGQVAPPAQNAEPVDTASYGQTLSEAPTPPPPLPDYDQPPAPGDNYMWTPGYWAYSTAGYYWTPGVWVEAPFVGALWTPPYWGYDNGAYICHAGYWGPYVGFYGGVNYGFGYTGRGFYGGYWQGSSFNYNRAVMNVNVNVVRNVYDRHVDTFTSNRVSYNGGQGGLNVRPIASEEVAARQRRMQALPAQVQQQREAATNRAQFATENHGRPAIAAARPVGGPAERPVGQAPGMAREAQPMSSRPEERAPMQANQSRPEPVPMNARPSPMERPRQEQAPRMAAPEPQQAPREVHQGEAQRAAPPARQMEARPAPEARQPAPRAEPMARPEAPRPAPEARQPMPHSAPEVRQQPPAPHAAPEARPPAPQGGHPPEAHPAPQKDERKHG